MSIITPNTNLKFLKCDLSINNKHQIDFANINDQFNYFNNLSSKTYSNYTYQRKDNTIRVQASYDDLINFNYVMYQNSSYSNKWYYAFIIKIEYINDNMCAVSIKTDVFQTYQFDYFFMKSFVEREHISKAEDIPGANLEPESLEIGEPLEIKSFDLDGLKHLYVIAYSRNPQTDNLTTATVSSLATEINGMMSALFYWVGNGLGLRDMLSRINKAGFSESIITIYTIPAYSIYDLVSENSTIWTKEYIDNNYTSSLSTWITNITNYAPPYQIILDSRPNTINGYTPKNAKCLTYPYLYIGITPSNGSAKILRFENFTNDLIEFNVVSEINLNPQVLLIPLNYQYASDYARNINELAILSGYPNISFYTDYFNSWIAQNSSLINLNLSQSQFQYEISNVRQDTSLIANSAKNVGNILTGNIIGGATNLGIDYANYQLDKYENRKNYDYAIQNQLANIEKQQLLPNSANLSSTSGVLLGYNLYHQDIIHYYSIKREFLEKIDNYFSMFGYLTNKLKYPNLRTRSNFNYIKTIGCNILSKAQSKIPADDLEELKLMFDTGFTIWHNSLNFLNYDINNI